MATDSKRLDYATLGKELLTEARKRPNLPLFPGPCAQRPAQAWSWLDTSQGAAEVCAQNKYVPKTSEQPAAQWLMWTTAHVAIDKMLTCPKARPTAGPDFPKNCTEMQSSLHSIVVACFYCWFPNHHVKLMDSNCCRCKTDARHVSRQVPPNQRAMRLDSTRGLALLSVAHSACARIDNPLD